MKWFESPFIPAKKEMAKASPTIWGPSGETREIKVSMRSSPHRESVHRTLSFKWFESPSIPAKKEMAKAISFFAGPSGETRTRGILLPKQARYQLRYTRKHYRNILDQLA